MKKIIVCCLSLLITFKSMGSGGEDALSPVMIGQEVIASLKEHERQKNLREEQILNTGIETANEGWWNGVKTKTKKLQERLRFVEFALQAIPVGYAIVQKGNKIIENQQYIIQEIQETPLLFVEFAEQEFKFVDDFQMILRFLLGIVVSYGAINQMEKAERKILLDFALDEVNNLYVTSWTLLNLIRQKKQAMAFNQNSLLNYYIQRDKEIVNDIINNFKAL